MSEVTAEPLVPLALEATPEPGECQSCGNSVFCEPSPFAFVCGRWICRDCGEDIEGGE